MAWNVDIPTAEYFDHTTPGLDAVVREVLDQKTVAIDTETTGLVKHKDICLYWSLAWGRRRMTLHASTLPFFTEVFADTSKNWVLANAKYDAHILANMGMVLEGDLSDVCVMHSLLYNDRPHGLKYICNHLLGWKWSDFQDTFGKICATQSPRQLIEKAERENMGLLIEYAANDAWGTLASYIALKKQLEEAYTDSLFSSKHPYIETLWDLYSKVEVPYTKVLWHNERNGVLIDQQYLEDIAPTAIDEIQQLERDITKNAGFMLNPASPSQLRDYFFDRYTTPKGDKLTPMKKTKGGKSGIRLPSVDAKFLEMHKGDVPMAALVLRHRELSKLYGTYIKGLSSKVDRHGRIHCSFNQDVARTGRLSSSDPNLQNIPNASKDKWGLRGAFIAKHGYSLIVADYEQLEMRLLACGSQEPGMIEVIKKGWDIHMGNASMIFGLPYEDIKAAKNMEKLIKSGVKQPSDMTPYMSKCITARADSKTIGFGLIYGMGDALLASNLGCTKEEAAAKSKQFMSKYNAVKQFTTEAIDEACEYGYAFTILGRRRNLPEIHSPNKWDRRAAERQAVNTPIQGSAADVVKMAQIMCFASNMHNNYGANMLMQVHDELMFEVPNENVEVVMDEVKEWMEHPFVMDLDVPLGVDINSGPSWAVAK